MIMSLFWCACAIISTLSALYHGTSSQMAASLAEGASSGVTITLAIAGPLSLWTGINRLAEKMGLMNCISKLLKKPMTVLFPSSAKDQNLANALSGNFCANLMGIGNAATPMGIQAIKRLKSSKYPTIATNEMCRFVVMNTASVQLIPTTVSALRAAEGCATPFDILPCVWISSLLSLCAGLTAAYIGGKVWKDS